MGHIVYLLSVSCPFIPLYHPRVFGKMVPHSLAWALIFCSELVELQIYLGKTIGWRTGTGRVTGILGERKSWHPDLLPSLTPRWSRDGFYSGDGQDPRSFSGIFQAISFLNWLCWNRNFTGLWEPQACSYCLFKAVQFPQRVKPMSFSGEFLYYSSCRDIALCHYCHWSFPHTHTGWLID